MLAVSPLRYNTAKGERDNQIINESFPDFGDGSLLDSINFDDLVMGINDIGDVLPDLEMDSEILAEFPVSSGDESDIMNNNNYITPEDDSTRKEEVQKAPSDLTNQKSEESASVNVKTKSKENDKGKKSPGQSKKPEGKRKTKVDWTPELHRRFVQALEQLGIDKAVPSRILELMGIEGLTRHNIASHLQKYRSHRKHLLAREAEAASWSQRRQLYGVGGGGKRDISPWPAPTMGFPLVAPPPMPHFKPLHVWGHPPPAWAPIVPPHPSPPANPSFWHPHHQGAPATPCFLAPIAPTRFPALPVPGIPPPAIIKSAPSRPGQDLPKPPCDFHPSKENIDAAIEDVLTKPCLPLPLGLKPPSIDSVLNELQRQGITKIPPTVSGSY